MTMAHTVHMNQSIRPGTARRLGLNPPPVPYGPHWNTSHRTAEQRTQIERAWLLHSGDVPIAAGRVITRAMVDGVPFRDGGIITAAGVRRGRRRSR